MKVTKAFHDLGLQVCVCSYDGCPNVKILSKNGQDVLLTGPELWKCGRCKFWICEGCSGVHGAAAFCESCGAKRSREKFYREQFEVKESVIEADEDDDDEDPPVLIARRRKRAETEKNKNDTTLKCPDEIFAELKKIYSTHGKKMYDVPGLHGLYIDVREMFKTPKQPDEQTWLRTLRAAFEKLVSEIKRKVGEEDDDEDIEEDEEDEDFEFSSSFSPASEDGQKNKKAKKDGDK